MMTGLTDAMRSDFRLMQAVANITRISPQARVDIGEEGCNYTLSSEVQSPQTGVSASIGHDCLPPELRETWDCILQFT